MKRAGQEASEFAGSAQFVAEPPGSADGGAKAVLTQCLTEHEHTWLRAR